MRKQNTYTLAQVRAYDSRPVNGRQIVWKKELLVWIAIAVLGGDDSVKPYELLVCAFGAWLIWDKLLKRRNSFVLSVFRGLLVIPFLMVFTGGDLFTVSGFLLLATAAVWGFEFWKNKK